VLPDLMSSMQLVSKECVRNSSLKTCLLYIVNSVKSIYKNLPYREETNKDKIKEDL